MTPYKTETLVNLTRIRLLDKLVILGFVALLITLYATTWQSGEGEYAIVHNQQHEAIIVPLDTDRTIDIHGALGISKIEVKDGKIRFEHSPCKGKVCIHAGWHRHNGDVIACLPNKVSLQIASNTSSPYDSINF